MRRSRRCRAEGFAVAPTPYAPLGICASTGDRSLVAPPVARRRPHRGAGRRQPAGRPAGGAAAHRHGRRLLRRRRRQDAAARRDDALAGPAVRVRRRGEAARASDAAPCALGAVERASAGDRATSATRRSSGSPARSTACSSMRRAPASARCAAIPISSGGRRRRMSSSSTAKQARILAAAATLVKPGGRLVYATCSVLPEENDAIVDAFLAAHPDVRRARRRGRCSRTPACRSTPARGCACCRTCTAATASSPRCWNESRKWGQSEFGVGGVIRDQQPDLPPRLTANYTSDTEFHMIAPIDFSRLQLALASPRGWLELAAHVAVHRCWRGRSTVASTRARAARRERRACRAASCASRFRCWRCCSTYIASFAMEPLRRAAVLPRDRDADPDRARGHPHARVRAAPAVPGAGVAAGVGARDRHGDLGPRDPVFRRRAARDRLERSTISSFRSARRRCRC